MSIRLKLFILLIPLGLASGLIILALSAKTTDKILMENLAERGRLQLLGLSEAAASEIAAKDEGALLLRLNQVLRRMDGAYAMALDASGAVVAHTNVMEKGKRYGDPTSKKTLLGKEGGHQIVDYGTAGLLDIWLPVWVADEDFLLVFEEGGKRRLGTLRLGIPIDSALTTKKRLLDGLLFILLSTGGAGGLILFLFLHKALHPIRQLALASKAIEEGRYGIAISVASEDEVGDLTRNFNRMSEHLAATTVSKDYVESILRSIVDVLVVTDPRGRIKSLNQTAETVFARPREELLGAPAQNFFLTAGGGAIPDFESLTAELKLKSREYLMLDRRGQGTPVLVSGSALRNAAGEADGFVLIAKDLSALKEAESALIQTEKLSAVGQLAAGVAHEINNPLGIILGFAQSAKRKLSGDSPLSLAVSSIEREAQRCKRLVASLLTFSRQNRHRMEETDLNAVVLDTLDLIQARARVKSVDIRTELKASDLFPGDKNQLQQVLINLCNNAIDAMPDGGVLTIRTGREDSGRHRNILLRVEDTGNGIAEEIRGKIFNPFFTTKEVGKGTGLGLSLVHEIIQRHKGWVDLQSAPGRGTVFFIRFPVPRKSERPMV